MENERAIEILDPEHREAYESLEPVNEACRMGVEALRRRVPESPYPDGDAGVMACPSCGSGEYLHNEDGNRCRFCGQCGQAIDWDGDAGEEAEADGGVGRRAGMKVYLAGKITGDQNYREKFAAAAKKLEERAGVTVISPAVTPEGLKKADYMRICFAMLESADTAVFLPDWEDSPGAQLEKHWCEYVGKKMVFLMEGAE